MSKKATSHTPGPGGLESCGSINGTSEFAVTAHDSSLPNIAGVNGREGESAANANLIAAAPEMLSALLYVCEYYSEHLDIMPVGFQTAVNECEQAINAAQAGQ